MWAEAGGRHRGFIAFHWFVLYLFRRPEQGTGILSRTTKRLSPMRNRNAQLVAAATKAYRHAHAPYSKFRVGAALLTRSGAIYTGCNVESSSYSLTICAERTALFKAISEGERDFEAIAIVSDRDPHTPPCGACRQVLLDLAGDIDVILGTRRGKPTVMKLRSLLPKAFGDKNLLKRKRTR